MAAAAIPAIGLLAGAALGLLPTDVSTFATPLLAVAALTALVAWRCARPLLLTAAIAAAFCCGGGLLAEDAWRKAWRPTLRVAFEELARAERAETAERGQTLPENDTAQAVVTGVLRSDAVSRPNGVALSIAVTSLDEATTGAVRTTPVSGGVLLTVVGELARRQVDDWHAGRTIRAPVQLRRPTRYLNPGVADEERALARRGVTLVGTVKSGALVEIVDEGSLVAHAAFRIRAFARQAIAAAVGRWSHRSAGIVTAIVIGDRTGLDPEVERRLQEAGTYHVIAISGGNIAILAGVTLAGFRLAGVLGPAAMLTAIAGLIAYAGIAVGGASVTRATLMAVVYFAARAIDLRAHPLNALAFVAALVVAAEPLAIVDPGFLLTFGATAAIVIVMAETHAAAPTRLPSRLLGILVASIAVEAALMPIAALFFSRVTFAGLILNFAAIPLMAVAQLAGMIAVAAAPLSTAAAAAAGLAAHAGAAGLVWSSTLVDWMRASTWRVVPPHWVAVLVYYACLLSAGTLWRRARKSGSSARPGLQSRVAGLAAFAAGAAAVWILFEPWRLLTAGADGRLHVTFIDVGQGDAAVVRFPRGRILLVDAGGAAGASTFDVGDRVVGAVLRHAGVRRLDRAALTHGDGDHIGGLTSIVREFRPREVWEGIPVERSQPLTALRAAATAQGASWTNLQTDDRISIDGVDIVVRHPRIADWERHRVRNDDSIVLELLWRDVSIVLTGDIGRDAEQAIAPLFGAAGIRVLKVPHHGSRTSSSQPFLDVLAPRVAIVSAGRSNTFGHPAPDVLQRYRGIGAKVFRTDQDGAIELTTDGYSVSVDTFTGRRLIVR